jgi:hypothetical protein
MREIALFSASLQLSMFIPWVLVIVRAMFPFIARAYTYGDPIYGFENSNWSNWLYTILEIIIGSSFVYFNYVFVYAGLIDFHRRKMMLQACGVLIDPIKTNYCTLLQVFPTINLLDVHSL